MKKGIILFAIFWIAGCGEKLMEAPADLIPPETMSRILYDVAILDAIDNSYPEALERNDLAIMPFVYEKYGIDSLQFASSDHYYATRPDIYERIYREVEERIGRERDSIGELIREGNQNSRDALIEAQRKKDSL